MLAFSRYLQLKSKFATFCGKVELHLYGFSIEMAILEKFFGLKCIFIAKIPMFGELNKIKKFCSCSVAHCIKLALSI